MADDHSNGPFICELTAQTVDGVQKTTSSEIDSLGELTDSLAAWLQFEWMLEIKIVRVAKED